MIAFLQRIAVMTLVLGCFACPAGSADETSEPVYQRERGGHGGGPHVVAGSARGPYRHAYARASFRSPPIHASWYQRPYPYHFDYYRWRYSSPPVEEACPCQEFPAGPVP